MAKTVQWETVRAPPFDLTRGMKTLRLRIIQQSPTLKKEKPTDSDESGASVWNTGWSAMKAIR